MEAFYFERIGGVVLIRDGHGQGKQRPVLNSEEHTTRSTSWALEQLRNYATDMLWTPCMGGRAWYLIYDILLYLNPFIRDMLQYLQVHRTYFATSRRLDHSEQSSILCQCPLRIVERGWHVLALIGPAGGKSGDGVLHGLTKDRHSVAMTQDDDLGAGHVHMPINYPIAAWEYVIIYIVDRCRSWGLHGMMERKWMPWREVLSRRKLDILETGGQSVPVIWRRYHWVREL